MHKCHATRRISNDSDHGASRQFNDASLDGREVIKWTGDGSSLSAIHETPNGKAMMLRSFFCRYRIH